MSVIPTAESDRRMANCKKVMAEKGVDSLLVFSDYLRQHNMRYLAGYLYHPSWLSMSTLVIPLDGEPTLTIDISTSWNINSLKKVSWIKDIRSPPAWMRIPGPAGVIDPLVEATVNVLKEKKLDEKRIGLVGLDAMPAIFYEKLRNGVPNANFKDVSEPIERLRVVKSDFEVDMIRKIASIADSGMKTFLENVRVGKTEADIGTEVNREITKLGKEEHIGVFVRSGPENTVSPGVPQFSNRVIQDGDLIWSDLGIAHNGYFGDVARSTIAGKATEEKKKLLDACLTVIEGAIAAMKPSVSVGDVYKAATQKAVETGYEKYFVVGYWGHGIGTTLDEFPTFRPDETTALKPNMVMTISPKFYVPGFGGVVIEDQLVVTKDGVEVLNKIERKQW